MPGSIGEVPRGQSAARSAARDTPGHGPQTYGEGQGDHVASRNFRYAMDLTTDGIVSLPQLDARIPPWSLERLSPRLCPLCQGTNEPAILRPDQLLVAYCADCSIWYVSSLPPVEEISQLYQGYWFSYRPKDLSLSYAKDLLSARDLMTGDLRLNRLSALSGGLEGKRLLEIGCGCGELLVGASHRGALVIGNDISQESCAFVRDKLNIPVQEGPLCPEAFRREFGQMDIVVMSDLIEHPPEPLVVWERAVAVLKPGGLLLVLTPNGGVALDSPSAASRWVGFRVDLEHLQYFSAQSIARLAAKYHCDIEHLEVFGYPELRGIDRLPNDRSTPNPGSFARSLTDFVKGHLKKSTRLRKIVWMLRSRRAPPPADPRCGTYHLFAILRKQPEMQTVAEVDQTARLEVSI